jgi:methylmalonyl-CoA mutase N-terminal domain/subunit
MSEKKVKHSGRINTLKTEQTLSGITPKEAYEKQDIESFEHEIGKIAGFPYTRGKYPKGYRHKLWLKQQAFGFISAEESGKYLKYLVDKGLQELRYSPDNFNLAGVDPDHPMMDGTIGFIGIPTYSIHQMEKVLEGINLDEVFIDFNGAVTVDDALKYAMLLGVFERRGVDITELRGAMVNDPLHAYGFETNPAPFNFEVPWKITMDAIEYSAQNTPQFHPVVPCGYNMSENGITCIQELAYILCIRMEYIDAAIERGLSFDSVGPEIPLEFACEIDFFETICKIRAARRMWAKLSKERYNAKTLREMTAPASVQLAGSSMVKNQPIYNIVRLTSEAISAVLGGVQAMQLIGFDEPLAIISYDGGLINAGIEEIIGHETGIPLVTDPLGGSYYVEWLTKKIEDEAWKIIQRIEKSGGFKKAIESGLIQEEVRRSVIERQKRIDQKDIIKVCDNEFQHLAEEEIPIRTMEYKDPAKNSAEILADFHEFKKSRDNARVKEALLNIKNTVKNDQNIIGPVKEAYKMDATMGETVGVINQAMGYGYDPFGMIQPPDILND